MMVRKADNTNDVINTRGRLGMGIVYKKALSRSFSEEVRLESFILV
jgi:hypothetical protein